MPWERRRGRRGRQRRRRQPYQSRVQWEGIRDVENAVAVVVRVHTIGDAVAVGVHGRWGRCAGRARGGKLRAAQGLQGGDERAWKMAVRSFLRHLRSSIQVPDIHHSGVRWNDSTALVNAYRGRQRAAQSAGWSAGLRACHTRADVRAAEHTTQRQPQVVCTLGDDLSLSLSLSCAPWVKISCTSVTNSQPGRAPTLMQGPARLDEGDALILDSPRLSSVGIPRVNQSEIVRNGSIALVYARRASAGSSRRWNATWAVRRADHGPPIPSSPTTGSSNATEP